MVFPGNALHGSGSSHTFSRVANAIAERFGIGSRPSSNQHSRQPSRQDDLMGIQHSRVPTQYYDTQSRRESHDTVTTPAADPIGGRSESPFTTASRSASSATAFRAPGRQTTENGSPNGGDLTWPSSQPRAASTAGVRANGYKRDQQGRSQSTAQ